MSGSLVESIEGLGAEGCITAKPPVSGAEILLLALSYGAGAGAQLQRHDHQPV